MNDPDALNSQDQITELIPLEIIRTETVLSKLPIHNLAKRGKVNIHISRKNEQGEIVMEWKVSPNPDYGDPRQLAYKLDTIIINQRIDKLGRPLPKIIKLSSLNELCRELGSQKSELKLALQQNATTAIAANLIYKGKDGSERHLEAVFTRYSVVFTGKKLPNGTKADAVYVILNEPYWEVLNNAPERPLDYAYLKVLTPGAQRFYELISFRIFAALKYQQPRAKMLYSEYCTAAPQSRHSDYEHVKKQMYKLHKPHKQAKYLAKVSYELTLDERDKPDWIIWYTPGPKAQAEYKTFHKKKHASQKRNSPAIEQPHDTSGAPASEKSKAPVPPSPQTPEDSHSDQAITLVRHFYSLFHKIHHTTPQQKELEHAARLIADHGFTKAKHVVDFACKVAPETKFQPQTFGGILHYTARALDDYQQQGKARQKSHEKKQRQQQEERQLQEERARHEQLEAQYRTLPPATQAALTKQARSNLLQQGIKEDFLLGTALKLEIYHVMEEQEAKKS